jgi:hypothetical protein
MYRSSDRAPGEAARIEEVLADGWRVDPQTDHVLLFQQQDGREVRVLDIPKTSFMRINEIAG